MKYIDEPEVIENLILDDDGTLFEDIKGQENPVEAVEVAQQYLMANCHIKASPKALLDAIKNIRT